MQDDLIERLQKRISAVFVKWDAAERELDKNALARIAALEADNARLMGLVKEAGEALERARNAMGAAIDLLPGGRQGYARGACEHEIETARATLAKIKEATDGRVTD